MHRTKVGIIALLALAVLVTALTGCGRKGLIRVNGEKISKDEFYARLERVTVQTPQGPKPAGRYVIEQIISEKLIQQLAKDKEVEPTEAQINSKIGFYKAQGGGDFAKTLRQRGLSMDDLKRQVGLEQAFVNVFTRGIDIPETDVKKAYDEALAAENSPFKRPEQVMISGIITVDKAQVDKAHKLLTDGQDFSAVAMQINDDPGIRQNQGKLRWIARADETLPKPLRDTAFSLGINKYSSPFKIDNQWLIIKADQKRPEKVMKYAEVKDMIKERMAVAKASQTQQFQKDVEAFTKKAEIAVNAERYKDIPESIKKQAAEAMEAAGKAPEQAKPGTQPVAPGN